MQSNITEASHTYYRALNVTVTKQGVFGLETRADMNEYHINTGELRGGETLSLKLLVVTVDLDHSSTAEVISYIIIFYL